MQRYQQLYMSDITGKFAVFDDQTNSNLTTAIYHKSTPESIWTLRHNMNSDCFIIQIFKDNNSSIELLDFVQLIKINDMNTVSIYFEENISGYVQMIFFTPVTI